MPKANISHVVFFLHGSYGTDKVWEKSYSSYCKSTMVKIWSKLGNLNTWLMLGKDCDRTRTLPHESQMRHTHPPSHPRTLSPGPVYMNPSQLQHLLIFISSYLLSCLKWWAEGWQASAFAWESLLGSRSTACGAGRGTHTLWPRRPNWSLKDREIEVKPQRVLGFTWRKTRIPLNTEQTTGMAA